MDWLAKSRRSSTRTKTNLSEGDERKEPILTTKIRVIVEDRDCRKKSFEKEEEKAQTTAEYNLKLGIFYSSLMWLCATCLVLVGWVLQLTRWYEEHVPMHNFSHGIVLFWMNHYNSWCDSPISHVIPYVYFYSFESCDLEYV